MPEPQVESFGSEVPVSWAGPPAEPDPVDLLRGPEEAGYVFGARIAATGRTTIL